MQVVSFIWFVLITSFLSFNAQASEPAESVSILVKDVGVMGLASHDLFAWDHKKKINKENGRLDLSTIFGNTLKGYYADNEDWYAAEYWKHGGNKKNRENAPVFTVTQILVKHFEEQISKGASPEAARLTTLNKFHKMVHESFERLTGLSFPQGRNSTEAVNNQEQASMRILHDILPGQILMKNGEWFNVTNYKTAQTFLCDQEMNCSVKTFDGDYDDEYKSIKIPLIKWLGINFKLNLQNIDRNFIANAGMDPDLAATQLKEIGEGKRMMADTYFAPYLTDLFSKAQSPTNTDGSSNSWVEKAGLASSTVD